jgi:hypothetical protein
MPVRRIDGDHPEWFLVPGDNVIFGKGSGVMLPDCKNIMLTIGADMLFMDPELQTLYPLDLYNNSEEPELENCLVLLVPEEYDTDLQKLYDSGVDIERKGWTPLDRHRLIVIERKIIIPNGASLS